MMKNNGKLSAMPQLHTIDGNWEKEPIAKYAGVTKREYFAVKAMEAMIISSPQQKESLCATAVEYADGLLSALENEEEHDRLTREELEEDCRNIPN